MDNSSSEQYGEREHIFLRRIQQVLKGHVIGCGLGIAAVHALPTFYRTILDRQMQRSRQGQEKMLEHMVSASTEVSQATMPLRQKRAIDVGMIGTTSMFALMYLISLTETPEIILLPLLTNAYSLKYEFRKEH